MDKPISTDGLHRWTETGVDCHEIQANCDMCPLFKLIGLHKNSENRLKKCRQADVNTLLLKRYGRVVAPSAYARTFPSEHLSKRQGFRVKQRIIELLQATDGISTAFEIWAALQEERFMDRGWGLNIIYAHLGAMKEKGIIKTERRNRAGQVYYELAKIKNMERFEAAEMLESED